MGQTLTHGIYLPDEGERNCYNGLAGNWQLLDGAVGTVAEHTAALVGKASAVHTHGKADITDLFNSANTWTGDNTFTAVIRYKTSYTLGNPPQSSDAQQSAIMVTDSAGTNYLAQIATFQSANATGCRITIRDKFDSNGFSPSGSNRNKHFYLIQNTSNQGYLKWDGYVNNSIAPLANNTYDLGSSSSQWNNLYAKGYYYNGTAWGLDKANEWTGENTFQAQSIYQVNSDPRYVYKSSSLEIGVQPTGSHTATSYWLDKNSNELGFTRFVEYNNSAQTYEIRLSNKSTNGALDPTGNDIATNIQLALTPDGVSKLNLTVNTLRPAGNGVSDLGDSTHRWKTLNGINPGALSLPDCQVTQSIDRTGWVYDGATYNTVLLATTDTNMTKNGWLYVRMANTTSSDKLTIKYNSTADRYPTNTFGDVGGYIEVFVPVVANTNLYLLATKDLSFCKFYPCLGNVPSGV